MADAPSADRGMGSGRFLQFLTGPKDIRLRWAEERGDERLDDMEERFEVRTVIPTLYKPIRKIGLYNGGCRTNL